MLLSILKIINIKIHLLNINNQEDLNIIQQYKVLIDLFFYIFTITLILILLL